MKYIFFIILILVATTSCRVTHVYIVRHAEKGTEPKNNPTLTEQGFTRANNLATLLQSKKIKTIYVTKTTRTQQTVEPLSKLIDVPIQFYNPDSVSKIFSLIKLNRKNTIIVGHSNTIIPMLDVIGAKHSIKIVADDAYDNLFDVSLGIKKATLKELKY